MAVLGTHAVVLTQSVFTDLAKLEPLKNMSAGDREVHHKETLCEGTQWEHMR